LADACHQAGLSFVLAHALYLKAIHGGKNKNDRIDSEKLAHLLRTNLIPPSYVYPTQRRPLRALLRQRMTYVWRRAELLARLQMTQLAQNRTPVRCSRTNRDPWEERLLQAESSDLGRLSLQHDLDMVRSYDTHIQALESELIRITKRENSRDFALLQTVPGIGRTLALILLYEIESIERFPTVRDFCSYCRLVKGTVVSAGKLKGLRGAKLGNPYLRWAFGEAAILAKTHHALIRPYADRLEARLGKFKANTVLALKLARAVYYMLQHQTAFDPERLVRPLA
jgi:transposase